MRKLKEMPYAQACVISLDDGQTILRSYRTTVVYIDADGWLEVLGLYSQTTRRHIGAFMREYGLDYALARTLHEDGMRYNIHTGEVA